RTYPHDKDVYRRAGVVIIPEYEEGVTEELIRQDRVQDPLSARPNARSGRQRRPELCRSLRGRRRDLRPSRQIPQTNLPRTSLKPRPRTDGIVRPRTRAG